MQGVLSLPTTLAPVGDVVSSMLSRVAERFDRELASDLPAVGQLVRHVERYRGKMLRPTLVMLAGLAAARREGPLTDAHVVVGAVVEMVHMATLVHDDVLDEATMRRRGETVNHLHGNEAAVILGDYLIAGAYHLCSSLPDPRPARLVGRASMVMCSGELLQLHHRGERSLDERTYFEIIDRKTAALIAASCELGAWASGADDATQRRLAGFGRDLGVAFQIQDDVLDLTGDEGTVGKSVGKDLEKGKLTLPLIVHLREAEPAPRSRAMLLIERASLGGPGGRDAAVELAREMERSGALARAGEEARSRVEAAKARLLDLPDTPSRHALGLLADAVIDRPF